MHKVITRAIKSIEYLSENETLKTVIYQRTLNDIRDLFIKLNSTENEWIELFCRQLDGLMSPNGEASMDKNWNNFLKKIKNEKKLMQREIEFQRKFGKRKNLKQLINENAKFINEYLQSCIYLYSKVQVNDLIENINDFLRNNCQLNQPSSIQKSSIEEHLQCIDIRLDCSNRFLANIDGHFATFIGTCRTVNHDLNNFYLRLKKNSLDLGIREHNQEQVSLNRNRYVPTRIPILVRINEFSTWLYQHETKTLKDYINILSDEKENIFEEFIDRGHALILLDGLDEIDDVRRREEIIGLICTPDFSSSFDDITHRSILPDGKTVYYEKGPPKTTSENQLILISRTIGYQFYPILGSYIHHYSLVLMEHKKIKNMY
ncbi:hypothetical protein I4U23_002063 [Adineta vaga]|nr:hypothetical protein I4U23_002063 [Adineta vaga]